MKITVLLENATPSDRYCSKHGLSMFIEGEFGRILFDMGPDGSFIDNARAMGIDVTSADLAIISHGHFDHGGGLRAFLELTEAAGHKVPIYIHERAFEAHRANSPFGLKDIGLDASLLDAYPERFIFTGDTYKISESLLLFANVSMAELAPASNRVLLERKKNSPSANDENINAFVPDTFAHEQTLLIHEEKDTTLVAGCSHCGIVNIIKKAETLIAKPLHALVAGFHLMNPASGDVEDPATVSAVAQFMAKRPTRYYTSHCTGLAAYSLLRDTLGERIEYLYTSSVIEV